MSARVTWDGLADFQRALRNLPDKLRVEARREGETAANAAAFEIRSAYGAHRVSGDLQESVVVDERTVAFGFRFRVRTKGAWATTKARWIESGTKVRHYITEGGVKHATGAVRAFHIWDPRIHKHQRRMDAALVALLVRNGLIVRETING